MIQENELVMLLMGIGVAIFILLNYRRLTRFPFIKILLAGFCALGAGWLLTILENFFWGDVLNFLEHTCNAAGAILTAVWIWMALYRSGEIH